MKLLTTKNAKIVKSLGRGYLTAGLHLLPGKTCSKATVSCLKSCLNTAGHGAYRNVQEARARKTQLFWSNPLEFVELLCEEIDKFCKKAERKGLTPALRLNLTSDIPWECYGVPQRFPNLAVYDYTKVLGRCPPDNYHLTFSRSETNEADAKRWLDNGGSVAVVFEKGSAPESFWGYPVIDGDEDDLRFLDPSNVVVGLVEKGRARRDQSGFVVRPQLIQLRKVA